MVATIAHGSWRTFLRAGRPDLRRRSAIDSRRGIRSGSLEILEARMLLSLEGSSTSGVGDAIAEGIRASAQVSVSAEESQRPTSVTVSLLPADLDPDAASPRYGPTSGATSFSVVARPAIFLSDQDGNLLSSLDGPGSTGGELYFGAAPEWTIGMPDGDPSILAEQAKELTPEGLAALPAVPWAHDASIKGTLTSDRGWMSFTVPVGPNTTTIRMAVRPEHEGDAAMAMVDQIYLISPNGRLIAAVAGVASGSPGRRQTLVVSLQSAPAGGVLVVRMVHPSVETPVGSNSPSGSGDGSDGLGALPPSTFDAPTDFTVEVQRDDDYASSPGSSFSSPILIVPPATYAPPSTGSTGGHIGVLPSGNATNSLDSSYTVNTASRAEVVRTSADPIDVDAESPSVSLGPLISRGSPPMGPALATMIDDPAPSISRDDQAGRDRTLERLDGTNFESALSSRRDARREGSDVTRPDGARDGEAAEDDAALLTALKGLGGLPLMVASARGRRLQERADELAATLRENAEQVAELTAPPEGSALAPAERPSRDDEIAKAGLATRAVGFVIALGLASGPLYPDLVALARRKLSRKRRGGFPLVRRFFNRRSPLPLG